MDHRRRSARASCEFLRLLRKYVIKLYSPTDADASEAPVDKIPGDYAEIAKFDSLS